MVHLRLKIADAVNCWNLCVATIINKNISIDCVHFSSFSLEIVLLETINDRNFINVFLTSSEEPWKNRPIMFTGV